jgi:hypothetical protein
MRWCHEQWKLCLSDKCYSWLLGSSQPSNGLAHWNSTFTLCMYNDPFQLFPLVYTQTQIVCKSPRPLGCNETVNIVCNLGEPHGEGNRSSSKVSLIIFRDSKPRVKLNFATNGGTRSCKLVPYARHWVHMNPSYDSGGRMMSERKCLERRLGCNALWFSRSPPTFRRNVPPPALGMKSKKAAKIRRQAHWHAHRKLWRCRRYMPLKRQYTSTKLHNVTTQIIKLH